MKPEHALFPLLFAASTLVSGGASANGRFPLANQLAFHPNDPDHFVVGATFGLLESRDGGQNFSWTCETVLGLADQEDPMIVISDLGTTVLATFDGIVSTSDGCDYRTPPELAGEIVPDIALSPGVPGQVLGFRTAGLAAGRFDSQLIRSDDGGQNWERLSEALPEALLPVTLDVSASNPERIYLTARLDRAADYESVLLRSDDGGTSFEQLPIPGTQGQRLAFIAAVHPTDPDRVYLRVDDNTGTPLLHSRDGGQSYETLFVGSGRLLGFALSPDGETIAFGGPSDGLWAGTVSDLERRSDLRPTCLRFVESILFACANGSEAGFSLARSTDLGGTFQPILTFETLCGPSACGPDTQVGSQCGAAWNAVGPQVGANCGVTLGGGGGAATGAAGGGGAAGSAKRTSGCSVSIHSNEHMPWGWSLVLLLRAKRRALPFPQVARSIRPSA